MFIANYNPKIDDVFLYDETNSGFPIALNPGHPLYGYKNSLMAIGARSRTYSEYQKNPDFPDGPPAGTSLKQYPNYYNNNQVLCWWIGSTILGSSVHYTGTKPSDSSNLKGFSKKTTLQDNRTLKFWKDDTFSELEQYTNFYNIYTHVPSNLVRTTNIDSYYFNGSAEIPGFASGATFYQISNKDYGFLNLVSGTNKNKNYLRTISLAELTKLKGIDIRLGSTYFLYNDFYLWDGQDRVIPVSVKISFDSNFSTLTVDAYSDRIQKIWDGDSSGLLLYGNGNELFSVGHTLSYSISNGVIYVQCVVHNNEKYPVLEYSVNNKLIGSNYIVSTSAQTVGASLGGISNLNDSVAAALTTSTNKVAQLIASPQNTVYSVFIDSIPTTDDAQIDQEYQNRYDALGVKEILFIYQGTMTANGTNIVNYNFGSTNVNESALLTYLSEQGITAGDYVAFNFNEDEWDMSIMGLDPFDPTMTGNNDEIINGPLNTGVTNIVISATNTCKTNFPNVYFTMWGWPYVPNYFTSIHPTGTDPAYDWIATTADKKLDRINFSVAQFKPVFGPFNWANPFCYDSIPTAESIENNLVTPNSNDDLANGLHPYNFSYRSAGNDEFRNAHITTTKNIATELNKTNFQIIPSISRWYAGAIYFDTWGRMIPNFEIKDYVKTLKKEFPEITKISIWASAPYMIKSLACGADYGVGSGSNYYLQQNVRTSIINLFYNGESPVPSTYPSWNNSTLRSEVVQKYNDYMLDLISQIKEFIK